MRDMSRNPHDTMSLCPDAKEVTRALVRGFGHPDLGNKRNPFNELLYIILSAKTRPEHYQDTYRALRCEFTQADRLADANPQDVAIVIRHGGLQNLKAQNIVSIAQRLKQEFGRVTLSPLAEMTDKDAEEFLTDLLGVSKKIARCVMLYALDRDVFPVDSNCFRIAQRLGWIHEDMRLTSKLADEFQSRIPRCLRRDLHVGLVVLGRRYCLPKNPRCDLCPLRELCETGRINDK